MSPAGAQGAVTVGRRRQPWGRFAVKAAVVAVGILAAQSYLFDRFRIAINAQVQSCLPGIRVLLIDTFDREPVRGGIFAYRARGLAPVFGDGTLMGKIVDAVPGDLVEVDGSGVHVNGASVVEGLPLADRLGASVQDLSWTAVVPEGRYLLLGRTDVSYDGRYWGFVAADQIEGRAYPLF